MKYKEIVKKLKKMGCEEILRKGGGSHRKWYNPQNKAIALQTPLLIFKNAIIQINFCLKLFDNDEY